MRIAKSLMVVGIVLIIVSFNGWTENSFSINMDYGEYKGVMIRTASDVNLTVHTEETSRFNLYIYEFAEGMDVIRTGFFDNATPILERANITIFREIVVIPRPSWYVVLATFTNNVSTHIEFAIHKELPQRWTFVIGTVVVTTGVFVLVIARLCRKSQM